jgi:hypothetical protein
MSSNRFRRIKRLGAALTAGALGVGFLPIAALTGTASASAPTPTAQSTTAFCANAPTTNPFTDLPSSNAHFANVLCLAAAGITHGTTATTYSPSNPVRRDQMASFIARFMDLAKSLETTAGSLTALPASGPDAFVDDNGDTHEASINRLAAAGIVNGTGPGTYSPADPVRRDQMASFINRAIDFLTGTPFSSSTDFFDDDNGDVHEANINGLAGAGIVQGTGGGLYSPTTPVLRDSMGSFIIRTAAKLNADGKIKVLPAPPAAQDFTVTPNGPAVNTVSTAAGPDANRGRRDYHATVGSSTSVRICLVPSGNVTVHPDGTVTFLDIDADLNRADGTGDTKAVIESVNGVAVTPASCVGPIGTTGGVVDFQVDSTSPNEAIIPIVWDDADNNGRLNLKADKTPSEKFGIGGLTLFIPPEASFGAYDNVEAIIDVPIIKLLTGLDNLFNPGAGENLSFHWSSTSPQDTFRYAPLQTSPQLTEDEWIANLNGVSVSTNRALPGGGGAPTLPKFRPGDLFNVAYADTAPSDFTIVQDAPAAPTAVTVAKTDADTDGAVDDNLVSWTAPVNKRVDGYLIYKRVSDNGGAFSAFAGIGIVKGKTNTHFNDLNAAPTTGTRRTEYIVVAYNLNQQITPAQNPLTLPNPTVPVDYADCNPAAPTIACPFVAAPDFRPSPDSVIGGLDLTAVASTLTPVSADSSFFDNGVPNPGIFGAGDSFTVTFSPATAPISAAAGASIVLQDSDGTQGTYTNGTNANFIIGGPNNSVLTVNLTGAPGSVVGGIAANNNLDVGGTVAVLTTSGITNSSGEWNLPESGRFNPFFGPAIPTVRSRVVGQSSNTNLPHRIAGCSYFNSTASADDTVVANFNASVSGDAQEPVVYVDPSADTVRVKPDAANHCFFADGVDNGDVITVSNAKGVAIGTGTFNNGVTISTPGIDFGQKLYLTYRDRLAGETINGLPSETLVVLIAPDVPQVVSAFPVPPTSAITTPTDPGPATKQWHITWTDNNLPDNAAPCKGITQVGPAGNYQLFDAANNVLLATGQSVAPAAYNCANAGTVHDFIVTFDNTIADGTDLTLRIAPTTVQDPNNAPNLIQVFTFNSDYNDSNVSISITGASAGLGAFVTSNGDPDNPQFDNGFATEQKSTSNQPSFSGTATATDGSVNAVGYSIDGNPTFTNVPTAGTPTSKSWSFTTPVLSEGYHTLDIRTVDSAGSDAHKFVDFYVNAVAPSIVSATRVFDPNNAPALCSGVCDALLLTFSEPVSCPSTTPARNPAFGYLDESKYADSSTPAGAGAWRYLGNGQAMPTASTTLSMTCLLVSNVTGMDHDDFGTLTYTQPATSADQIKDAGGTSVGGGNFNVVDNTKPDINAFSVAPVNGANTFSIRFAPTGADAVDDPDSVLCSSIQIGATPALRSFRVLVNGTEVAVNIECGVAPGQAGAGASLRDREVKFTLTAGNFATGQTVRVEVGQAVYSDADPTAVPTSKSPGNTPTVGQGIQLTV